MGHPNHGSSPELKDDVLAALARLARGATPGPWSHRTERDPDFTGSSDPAETGEWEIITGPGPGLLVVASELEVADAEFLVAARTYLPALVAEIRRLRAALES